MSVMTAKVSLFFFDDMLLVHILFALTLGVVRGALIPSHGQEWLDEVAGQVNVTKTPGGLLYKEVTAGAGVVSPGKKDECKVHYRASLYDGTEFDSTYVKGEPVLVSPTQMIAGVREALLLMQEGDVWEVFLPHWKAFGKHGLHSKVPPYTAVKYDLELVQIVPAATAAPTTITKGGMTAGELTGEDKWLAEVEQQPGVLKGKKGLLYKVLGTGGGLVNASKTDFCKVHFRGSLYDGTEFATTHETGEPAFIPIKNTIMGLSYALQMMREGDKWEIYLPPRLAYGWGGLPTGVTALTALQYELELLQIIPANSTLAAEVQPEAPNTEQAWLAEQAAEPGVTKTSSGMLYKMLHTGTGTLNLTKKDRCVLHYRGTLPDGTEVESTLTSGTPANVTMKQLIKGLQEALRLMREGDKWEVFLPNYLAYGPTGLPPKVPPFSPLMYELELVQIIPAAPPVAAPDAPAESVPDAANKQPKEAKKKKPAKDAAKGESKSNAGKSPKDPASKDPPKDQKKAEKGGKASAKAKETKETKEAQKETATDANPKKQTQKDEKGTKGGKQSSTQGAPEKETRADKKDKASEESSGTDQPSSKGTPSKKGEESSTADNKEAKGAKAGKKGGEPKTNGKKDAKGDKKDKMAEPHTEEPNKAAGKSKSKSKSKAK
eukprot:GGOE01002316.1.p1 GENE.GGOE01002316.1~~GGOE01002316.1.p1  ORF type:complete len:661 (-),score=211.28 GGOE01002316.1:333-2315(-)